LCLLAVGAGAKLILVSLRIHDGAAAGLRTAWAPVTLLYQEVWAALAWFVLDLMIVRAGMVLGRPVLADRLCWGVYALLAGYVAINVPVARQFSTPLTLAFLEAAGLALRDSITAYATLGNIIALLGGGAVAIVCARWIRGRRPLVWGVVAAIVLVLGPIGARRSDTLGLHRGALATLVTTAWARWAPRSREVLAVVELPAEGPALDLSHLTASARGLDVIWVILESTGARHLKSYGATLDATPRLTGLAQQALIFERMYTSYPESIKSLLPILCGAAPALHTPAHAYAAGRSPCEALPVALAAAGYRTGLFHSGRFVYLGMADMVEGRGFDVLADAAVIGGPHAVSFGTDDRSTVRRVLQFIDEAGDRPYFALYMPIAGHHPYRTPGTGTRPFPATSEQEHHRNDLYVGDEALGELIDGVRARGRMDRTLWIVMGDHGEAFHEHPANFAHSLFVYEENVHIPVIMVVPGALRQALRVPQVGGTIDLAPTLLDLLGLGRIGAGRSLLRGEPGVARFFTDHSGVLLGLRHDRWKCIVDVERGTTRLFDLEADPGETEDVAAREPARAQRYQVALAAWAAGNAARLGR
jgi:hypothetical protein